MPTVFTPEHSPLDRIFAADSTYRIPAYQRPYSWEAIGKSDRDRQVIQMWEDLWEFFESNRTSNKEYFLGSMVIIEETSKLRTFEVIDGQQRLTTLLLLFSAMRCFLEKLDKSIVSLSSEEAAKKKWFSKAIQTLEGFLYNEIGPGLVPDLKLKIERTVGANFNDVMINAVACRDLSLIAKLDKKHKEIAQRYFKNRDYFQERLEKCFFGEGAPHGASLDIQKFDDFFKFLRTRVAIVLIKSADFSTAYRIFEILNNRGLPLTNLDLLRNFVLEQLNEAKIPDPDLKWERLERDYVLTEDFVGRWSESVNGTQPQTSAFNEARRLYDEYYKPTPTEKKIEVFYRNLENNLNWYNLILEEEQRIEHLGIQKAISFIKQLGNDRYSTDLLLSLFRCRNYQGNDDPEVLRFLQIYRSYALHVFLLGRFYSPKAYEAVKLLNAGKIDEATQLFILSDAQKAALFGFFDDRIEKNDQAKLLLAACIWQSEIEDPDVVSQRLQYEKSTLEHIIPQNPEPGTNWLTDFDDEFRQKFTYKLGNMTLLTQAKNSANKNYDFARKKLTYAKAKLAMTARLAERKQITQAYLEERHREIIDTLFDIFLR